MSLDKVREYLKQHFAGHDVDGLIGHVEQAICYPGSLITVVNSSAARIAVLEQKVDALEASIDRRVEDRFHALLAKAAGADPAPADATPQAVTVTQVADPGIAGNTVTHTEPLGGA